MDDITELWEPCACCGGIGKRIVWVSERQHELLRGIIAQGGKARSADLPQPGSTQRMAIMGLVRKRLVSEQAYYGEGTHAARYEYTITDRGRVLVRHLAVGKDKF